MGGKISQEEMKALDMAFEKFDINHDKYLSQEELVEFLETQPMLGGMDAENAAKEFLKAADLNKDSKLSIKEFRVFLSKHIQALTASIEHETKQ